MDPFKQISITIFLLVAAQLSAYSYTISCSGITNDINQPTSYCSAVKPKTYKQPAAKFPSGHTILYDWEISNALTGTYTSVASAIRDLPVPAAPGVYYMRRIVYLERKISGVVTIVQRCESVSVKVEIIESPTINVTSPTVAGICSGSGTSFSVNVSPATVSIQWQYENVTTFANIPAVNRTYSGAKSPTLNILNVSGLGDVRYRCVATQSGCKTYSPIFLLHENPVPAVTPLSREVCESISGGGSEAIINLHVMDEELTAADPANLSVSWFTTAPRASIVDPANFQFTNTVVLSANVSNISTLCANDAPVTLTTKPFPVATATGLSPPVLCSGDYFQATLQGADQYTWTVYAVSGIEGPVAGQGSSIAQQLINTVTKQETVTYNIIPFKDGCFGPVLVQTVAVQPVIRKFLVTGGGGLCPGSAGLTIGLSDSQAGVDYELDLDGKSTGITKTSPGGPFVYPDPIASKGTFTIRASVNSRCETAMEGNATIATLGMPQGTGTISGKDTVCSGSANEYVASGWTDATSYQWILPPALRSVREDEAVAEIAAEQTGVVKLQVVGVNSCGAGTPATKDITILTGPAVTLSPQTVIVGQSFVPDYTTTTPLTQWQWNFGNGSSTEGRPTHTYNAPGVYVVSLNAVDQNGCDVYATASVSVITGLSANNIKNVITANGDPQNGYLVVENLEAFPQNEVVLLTRWGNEVFHKKGYANDWDARHNGYFLPAGNYLCIVRLPEQGKVFSRVVTVIKD